MNFLAAAIDRLIETSLDYERFDSLPVMPEQDGRSIQRQTYFLVRVSLAQLDTGGAANIVEAMTKHPAVAGASDPAVTVATTELALLCDEPIGDDAAAVIEAIPPSESTWRYASRVRVAIALQKRAEDAPWLVDSFLTSFGNEMRLWAAAGYRDVARAELLALVSRELRYGSHDPEAWRALFAFVDEAAPLGVDSSSGPRHSSRRRSGPAARRRRSPGPSSRPLDRSPMGARGPRRSIATISTTRSATTGSGSSTATSASPSPWSWSRWTSPATTGGFPASSPS